ncbi:MAG: TonB family protein [Alphaproteobacteria bacterium]|mgnify:CR=1 FL=1|nr:TonB family protein [Alphaproteobacteria bacterium]
MKLIHIICASVTASLLPTATALEPRSVKDLRTYAIAVTADAVPVSHGGMRYPYQAASRGLSGVCDLRVDVDATGSGSDVRLVSCSSEVFRRQALSLASKVAFKPGAPADDALLRIRWTIAGQGLRTASLD